LDFKVICIKFAYVDNETERFSTEAKALEQPIILMRLRKNLKYIVAGLLAVTGVAVGNSETPTNAVKAHQNIHREQLANVKNSKMDATVIGDMLKEDVASRENSVAKSLSPESDRMLDDLLKEARKHIGKPYRHGSKGPSAFDCSGFSSYVYRQFGYNLSPASRMQYTQGEKVERKNLRKGDLVFFTSRSSGKNVGHVGIVVDANNATGDFSFIHASISGVKINTCSGYYEGRYIGAKRIITE
jgi:cell wall-associated NlpC family hydrolase